MREGEIISNEGRQQVIMIGREREREEGERENARNSQRQQHKEIGRKRNSGRRKEGEQGDSKR